MPDDRVPAASLPVDPPVRRPPLPRWVMPVVAVVLLAAAGTTGWLLWSWIEGRGLADVDRRTTAQLDAVKIAASVAAGGGALFALYLAARRQRTQEQELDHRERAQAATEHDAAARRVTELYTAAAEQLGSDKAPVRLAGLHALERLAQDNERPAYLRQTVVDVLCAYLRMPFTPPGDPPDDQADDTARARHDQRRQEQQVRLTAQRILRDHLRPRTDTDHPADTFWPDTDLDLTDATLVQVDLSNCHIRNAQFGGASFAGHTGFDGASFAGPAGFDGASFAGRVWFSGASFAGEAEFEGASFAGPTAFSKASFAGPAGFNGASFAGEAVFRGASFAGPAGFNGASFAGHTAFGGASFAGPAGFNGASFAESAYFGGTSFTRKADFRGASFAEAAWFNEVWFANGAGFIGASFAGEAGFSEASFAGEAEFAQASFTGPARYGEVSPAGVDFRGASVAHPLSPESMWPPRWRPADEHQPVDDREGTWHRLIRIDDHPAPEPPDAPPGEPSPVRGPR
ncbi:pentapeptide repeat-containing protein [Saccharothrix obliqua]|uniref:pentapeptide repeat-containing protein n=1 Tax=Saccharothrix obliqua TaxID=2861747 RepID=UPI001C5EB9BD|nr:pentapeptide repeat-containing protein [Saccharothrix obliqua]MBW4722380.1 pentapeptide repeat-containing protein [Saccharothrix obliqua]